MKKYGVFSYIRTFFTRCCLGNVPGKFEEERIGLEVGTFQKIKELEEVLLL